MERAGFANGRADVAVVGAGLAGLVAAHELMVAGLSVVVLEARDRVGGRLLNHTLEGGAVVEVGGQWVGPTQDRVLALAEELGVGLFPTYIESEHFSPWTATSSATVEKTSPCQRTPPPTSLK